MNLFNRKKTMKTCTCLCIVPERHIQGLDQKKLGRVLRAYAALTALPVVSQFDIREECQKISYHLDSHPPSVSFIWTVPEDIEKDVVRITAECWKKISAINDQEGIDGMLDYYEKMKNR